MVRPRSFQNARYSDVKMPEFRLRVSGMSIKGFIRQTGVLKRGCFVQGSGDLPHSVLYAAHLCVPDHPLWRSGVLLDSQLVRASEFLAGTILPEFYSWLCRGVGVSIFTQLNGYDRAVC